MEWLNEITVDARSPLPILHQLKEAFKRVIVAGLLCQDEKLPSIRYLAARFKVHPNTMAKVYSHLELEGFIYARAGSGYFVRLDSVKLGDDKDFRLTDLCRDFWRKARQLDVGYDELTARLLQVSKEKGEEDD
jgi:GntR family transcriptional regulator